MKRRTNIILLLSLFGLTTIGMAAPNTTTSEKPATPSSGSAAATDKTPTGESTVWVNTKTGVYHRQNSPWYGKTKEGKYMSEKDAVAAGYHAGGVGHLKRSKGHRKAKPKSSVSAPKTVDSDDSSGGM